MHISFYRLFLLLDYYKFWLRSIDSFSDRNAQMIVVGTHAEETSTEVNVTKILLYV